MYESASTVFVSKKDKDDLLKYCKEIAVILNKYPYSNDHSDNFVTTMTRVKTTFAMLQQSIDALDIKKETK